MKTVNFKAKALLSVMLVSLFAVPMAQAMLQRGARSQQRSPFMNAAIVAAATTLAALLGISARSLWNYITSGSDNMIEAPVSQQGEAEEPMAVTPNPESTLTPEQVAAAKHARLRRQQAGGYMGAGRSKADVDRVFVPKK